MFSGLSRLCIDMDLLAFKQRILPVQNRLFRLATMFLRNREDAEDALQDVLMRLWTNRQQLETYQSVEALAVQMTKNLCLDRLKAHARQNAVDHVDLGNVVAEQLSPHRQTELAETHPIHRVCAWLGNSPAVAQSHYLQVTDGDFEEAAHQAAQQTAADEETPGIRPIQKRESPQFCRGLPRCALLCLLE